MAGYLESTRPRTVNKSLDWNVAYGSRTGTLTHLSTPIVSPEYVMTFRSGSRYEAELNGGATHVLGTDKVDRLSRAMGDIGHEFEHRKVERFTTHPRVSFVAPYGRYTGPMLFSNQDLSDFVPQTFSNIGYTANQLDVLGSSAIAQSYPTKPQADMLVAVAELLREGLPSAMFSAITTMGGNSKRELVQKLSGDYLNYIFGITPLVREADKLIKTVKKVNDYITQLAADSGNLVRRSRTIEDSSTYLGTKSTSGGQAILSMSTGIFDPFNRLPMTSSQTLIKRVWFSGAFRYWIPDLQGQGTDFQSVRPGDYATSFDIAGGIYGLRTTPKAAWNLLPFSWLVDWFINVSDLLENADAMNRYGLVMPYGYVMAESKLITTTTIDFANSSAIPSLGSVSSSIVLTRKQRKRASPYGFGLKDVDLNPIQMSILAALGLQAGRR